MQLTSIIAAAGLAAYTTNALLLPPEISEADNRLASTLPVPVSTAFANDARRLKLKCPGCQVRNPHHMMAEVVNNIPSHLDLEFSVESTGSTDRLMLNGFELYPNADPFRNSLTAVVRPDVPRRQTKRPMHFKDIQSPQTLGFGMQTRPISNPEESLELVLIDLDIIEVGEVFVDGIPNVQVKLVKTPTGQLMIGDIETTDPKQNNPMDKQEECTTMLCKWKAIIMQKLASLRLNKGCGGHRAHGKGHDQVKQDGSINVRPQDGNDSQPPAHRERNWGLLFKNIASHILLPVAIGLLAGVAASILGMMVGTFVVFLWRLVARRGSSRRHHRHGHHHKASHSEAVLRDEKSGLMAHVEEDDVLPPVYVEEGIVVLDDKKTDNVA
ncbi:uncharacterized protein GGS22DRAFT_165793 [Annulohypoxylon maeteangense]|uniref:uncharacterized protein n=1 Tax=Annulohypoxylon maeteangense TaxID=1927788 RepID=UPI002007BAED|nr:uncharacterized protein GGS22DRAFT_165793 [Annulohypoxylon maeteangense]KAI0883681.1 hypothetical protein GGS22DRAFT_165793 [Annulohypoxylon maeteangense]